MMNLINQLIKEQSQFITCLISRKQAFLSHCTLYSFICLNEYYKSALIFWPVNIYGKFVEYFHTIIEDKNALYEAAQAEEEVN